MDMDSIIEEVFQTGFIKAVCSNGSYEAFHKIVIRPIVLKGQSLYQFESFTKTQAFHDNVTKAEAIKRCKAIFTGMKQWDVFTKDTCRSIKISKKGKILQHRHKQIAVKALPMQNNRQKTYLLQEGMSVPAFVDLGIMRSDGSVVPSKYDKFKQINRFVEMVDDALKGREIRHLHVIDFGCGKSYLTFILYHYLVAVKKLSVTMVGLDLREDVIQQCQAIQQRYGYEHLSFEVGNIQGYHPSFPVDMVVSLHACDTATDYALANAIAWNATYILSVPCCQKEVNRTIRQNGLPILDYGLFKERYSSLVTDTIRAKTLEGCGYDVQVLEFIDDIHSPKNVLLRGVKQKEARPAYLPEELQAWVNSMELHPTLWKELTRLGVW